MVKIIAPQNGEVIIEIGAGHGELTLPLFEACERVGAKLIAIEKDSSLAKDLEFSLPAEALAKAGIQNLGTKKLPVVIHDDALQFFKSFPESHILNSISSYKVVGNIPYYLTGYLLRIIGELAQKPSRCVFTLQQEVAERLCASPPRMNRLAAAVGFWATPSLVAHIPKEYFRPPPKVDSVIVMLKTRGVKYETQAAADAYYRALRLLFRQPRKTILNNLAAAFSEKSRREITERLRALHINPSDRPENLSVPDISLIASTFLCV